MTPNDKLDHLLSTVGTMNVRLAEVALRVEYLDRADTAYNTRMDTLEMRVSAVERWRWTLVGAGIAAAALFQYVAPLIGGLR